MITTKPHVRLVERFHKVIGVITEGEDLTLTVALSETSTVDTIVNLTISNGDHTDIDNKWRMSKYVSEMEDTMNYVMEFFSPSSDTDYTTLDVQVIIPAGYLEASIIVPTVDDTTLTGGKGHFRVGKVSIVSQNNPDYQIHHHKNRGLILTEDANEMPKFFGKLEVWCKLGELAEYEPVIDPDTSTTVEIIYDWNMSEDGLSVESWAGSSKIIDDVPIESLMFKFLPDEIPVDVNKTDPVDFTTHPPFVRFQIKCGRRI